MTNAWPLWEKTKATVFPACNSWLNFHVRGQFAIKISIVQHINTTYFTWITKKNWTWACDMVMGYWSVAILFWQLSIDHIVNVLYKWCGLAKTHLWHTSLPFDSLPYPTRTICKRVRTLGQSRDNQTKRGWPYSMSMGLCPTRASRAGETRY